MNKKLHLLFAVLIALSIFSAYLTACSGERKNTAMSEIEKKEYRRYMSGSQ